MATELRLVEPRNTNAGAGIDWIGEGWSLFTRAALMWIVSLLLIIVIAVVAGIIPVLGSLAFQVAQPVFHAGFVWACRSLETGGEFEIEHVFAGFKRNFANLLVVGLLFLAGTIVLLLVFAVFAGFGMIMAFMTGGSEDVLPALMASGASFALGAIVIFLLTIPLMMAYWFAPALVMMHDMAPLAAMKESFRGCLRNILPLIVYLFVMMVLFFVACIPFGLGLLVWFPVMIASSYAAYRAIFTEQDAPVEPAMVKAA